MSISWQIGLLGELCLRSDEQTVTHFETRKTAALLAWLALHLQRAHSREALAELLWPEEYDTSRDRLRQALSALRKALEPDGIPPGAVLIADRAEIRLNLHTVSTDVAAFEAALTAANKAASPEARLACLQEAISQYGGELLPGYYEDWILQERERLAELYREALRQAARACAEAGNLSEAIGYARRVIADDPLREDVHADLMQFYADAGRLSDAIKQFRELERLLKAEFGILPSTAVRELFVRLQSEAALPAPPSSKAPPPPNSPVPLSLEPHGGVVPLDSLFYIERSVDTAFKTAIARQDSIVLVKGARQMGKTSLLARGLQQAREAGMRVVLTDLQKFTAAQLASPETLFLALAAAIGEDLKLEVAIESVWNPQRSWNVNFERFLRRDALENLEAPLVWALDEVDRLFAYPYRADVFGLFRAWHNERSLDPDAPWGKLTLAMAYATEAHLFITDLNQSPFNVGTRLTLADFTPGEAAEINRRYRSPLRGEAELGDYYALVGGHPYLVRRGLHTMIEQGMDFDALKAAAEHEDGPFGDHLRRLLLLIRQDAMLCDTVRALLHSEACPDTESFYRLRTAGAILGHTATQARFRCNLYRDYLARHLP